MTPGLSACTRGPLLKECALAHRIQCDTLLLLVLLLFLLQLYLWQAPSSCPEFLCLLAFFLLLELFCLFKGFCL